MQIHQLKTFTLIYENGSFARTAEQLFLTQSAVSQQLQRLEGELGYPLFERDRHNVLPTAAARVYYDYAKRIVALEREGAEALATQGRSFYIHFVDHDPYDPIQMAICQLMMEQPELQLHICPPLPKEGFHSPAGLEVQHLYLARRSREHHPSIHFAPLGCAFYQCALSRQDPLGRKSRLTLADLSERRLLFTERFRTAGSPWIGELTTFLRDQLGEDRVCFRPNIATIRAALGTAEKTYAWIRPGFAELPDPDRLLSRPLDLPVRNELGLAYIGNLSAPMQRFIDLAREHFPSVPA